MKNFFLILLIVIISFGCGHRKGPTGGPKDTVKPEILSIFPEEFSNIQGKNIEVVFSKPIERNTIISGLYIYPAILQKKFKWDKNLLTIRLLETLQDSTNYFFSFTPAIKGEHGNQLDRNYTFIFAGGRLNTNRISGNILYEKQEDANRNIRFKLMTADSTFVLENRISGQSYELDNLNYQQHIIEAFIDANSNEKYDYGKEAYCYKQIPAAEFISIDLEMNYADSLKPELKSANAVWSNAVEIVFSEDIAFYDIVYITSVDSLELPVNIIAQSLKSDKLLLLTEPLDTLRYNLQVLSATDLKKNRADTLQIVFEGVTKVDSIAPQIIGISPRNGATVDGLDPKITITFSEIILEENFQASLRALESKKVIELDLIKSNSIEYLLQPAESLTNYASYALQIDVVDINQNEFSDDALITFIPILR